MRETLEVRATMEGMAARLAAEKGISADHQAALAECIDGVAALIASRKHDEAVFRRFSDINVRFHTTIMEAAGNAALIRLIERNPFRSAPLLHVLPAEEALGTLAEAQRDHIRLVEAIRSGQAVRAEFLMREHALLPLSKAEQLFSYVNANAAMHGARETA
jgi:GntR family transcriptional regulator of vanillate catabolism